MKVVLTAIGSKYIHTALGLRSIKAYAEQSGYKDIILLEESAQTPILAVLSEITEEKTDIVGLSVHIWNKEYVYKLIGLLRKVLPQVKIVVGGPEVAFEPERIFAERPEIDYIIQGEGEEIFVNLLDALNNKTVLPKHVAYRADGKVICGSVGVLADLDKLAFPYPDLDRVIADKKIVYYECTRGCPFSCSYCLSGISHAVRKRNIELVLKDLQRFIDADAELVKFVDRTYNLDSRYFLPIMKYLAENGKNTTFHFEIKADLLNKEVLDFLQTVPAGRFQFEIGVQSTNPETLQAVGRVDNWQKLAENVKVLLGFGNIHLHLDLIAGLPYENIDVFGKSFNDVYFLNPHMLQLGFLKVLPGTVMRNQTAEHGLVYMDEPPYEILATKYISYDELRFLKILEDVFDHTYNTGKFEKVLSRLVEIENGNPFALYKKLTQWWIERGEYPKGHNVRGVALLLLKFIKEHYDEYRDDLTEKLRFDIFAKQPGWKPKEFAWHEAELNEAVMDFWRNKEVVRKYLPGYDFSTWREIKKKYPIEYFENTETDGEKKKQFYMSVNETDCARMLEIDACDIMPN